MAGSLFIFNSDNSMKKNQYVRFFKKIVIVLTILIIADQVTGRLMRHFYFNMVAGENYRTTFALDSLKSEIIIFGSSRASHHYVPGVFENKFKLTFYNAGRDGNYFLYSYATFKAVTRRYTPKLIIFDLNPNEMIYRKSDYEGLSTLLPYYYYHPELKEIIELRSHFEKYKMFSATYPFNSQLIRIIFRNLSKARDTFNMGYLPLYGKIKNTKTEKALNDTTGVIDKYKIAALNDITTYCKQRNISLIFVCSPVFSKSKESIGSKIAENIANSDQSRYWDFSNDSVFNHHPEYFDDNLHLNDDGAKLFSAIISNDIAKNINRDFIHFNSLRVMLDSVGEKSIVAHQNSDIQY